jgi:elongation factor Ts
MAVAITAKDVNELRQKTGLGMMECKAALTETGGDVQAAVDLLRKKGLAKMDGRSDRASAEGRIGVAVAADRSKSALIEINTETDFTAGNDSFKAMVQTVADEALKQDAGEVARTDPMQKAIDDVRLTTKENVQFRRGQVLGGAGAKVGTYVHFTGKIGVMVEVAGDAGDELLKDLCMHISAASPVPLGVTDSDIPADVIAKEREIAKGQAIESGKPEAIAEKMVEGKIRKFLEETVLLKQPFIKDTDKKIADLLPKGVTIKRFVRYQVGG